MTLIEFRQLDFAAKLKSTGAAVCVSNRTEGEYRVLLYQIDAFYFEVYFHRRTNKVSTIHGFDDTDLLAPYLKQINICMMY